MSITERNGELLLWPVNISNIEISFEVGKETGKREDIRTKVILTNPEKQILKSSLNRSESCR